MLGIKIDDIEIRLAEVSDAADVVRIRTQPQRDKYINPTSKDIKEQQQWIAEYKKREQMGKELFFVFIEEGHLKGVYRLSKINRFSFEAGSWVFEKTTNKALPKLADVIMTDFGLFTLKRNVMLFNIIKENERVWKIQDRKNPIWLDESDTHYHFALIADSWQKSKVEFLSFYQIDPGYYEPFHTALQMAYNDWQLRHQYELEQ